MRPFFICEVSCLANKITTWGDIMLRSLQKMFLLEDGTIKRNDSTMSYIAAMPGAYSEAIQLLSTTNRFIVKEFTVPADSLDSTIRIELNDVINNFYRIKPGGVYYENSDGMMYPFAGYKFVGESLFLPNKKDGQYRIFYYAFPKEVTQETKETEDLEIDPDVAALVPLYIASQLYKEDDISIATIYRNEFEIGRELLAKEIGAGGGESKFSSVTGWW